MAKRKKAEKPAKPATPAKPKREKPTGSVALDSRNVIMLFAGIVLIAVGYFLLARGSITAAPVLLVLGYCVVVPLSIILWVKRPDTESQRQGGE
jgi:hypothetical protein